jgi:hypothetical protein
MPPVRSKRGLLQEWASPAAFFQALDCWLADYNATYLHSAPGYRGPNVVESRVSRPRHYLGPGLLNGVAIQRGYCRP